MSVNSVLLGDVAEIIMGQAPPGDTYNVSGNGLPLVAGAGDFGIDVPQVKKFTSSPMKVSAPGDIIMSIRATIGTKVKGDREYCLGRGVAGLRAKGRLDQGYLWHWLTHAENALSSKGRGATFPQVSRSDIATLYIHLPPLDEQKRIAAILDKADALRAKRRQAIALLDSLTHSIFLEMFGDPVSNPKSWDVAKIGELFSLKHGFAFKSENFLPKGYYVLLTPGNFFEEGGFRQRGEKQRYHDKPVPIEYILKAGDILVAMTEQAPGLLGSPLIVPEDDKYLHNQRLGKVIKNVDIHSHFIVGLLNTPSVRARIQADSSGTKVKHTSPTKISDIEIGYPPLTVQKQYATRIETAGRAKSLLLESILKQDKLFFSLQHRAFTGQL